MINKEMNTTDLATVTGADGRPTLPLEALPSFRTYWNYDLPWCLQRLHGLCTIKRKDI